MGTTGPSQARAGGTTAGYGAQAGSQMSTGGYGSQYRQRGTTGQSQINSSAYDTNQSYSAMSGGQGGMSSGMTSAAGSQGSTMGSNQYQGPGYQGSGSQYQQTSQSKGGAMSRSTNTRDADIDSGYYNMTGQGGVSSGGMSGTGYGAQSGTTGSQMGTTGPSQARAGRATAGYGAGRSQMRSGTRPSGY